MAHAIHFLDRLRRLDDAHADFALDLYRNTPLVKQILARAGPSGAERIAIALSDAPEPPHVLVSAEGAFVTCLAAGMKHDLPVISRRAVENARRRHLELQAHFEAARRMRESPGALERGFRILRERRLPREDAAELFAWAPALEFRYLELYERALRGFAECRGAVQRAERLKVKHTDSVRRLWRSIGCLGNLLPLIASRIGRNYLLDEPEIQAERYRTMLAAVGLLTLVRALALRGIWALTSIADRVIDRLVLAYRSSKEAQDGFSAAYTLACIGLRWPRERARVVETLADMPGFMLDPDADDFAFVERLRSVVAQPGAALERHLVRTRARLSEQLPDLDGLDDRTILSTTFLDDARLDTPEDYRALADALAFVAVAEPEELFVPRALLARLPPEDFEADARRYAGFMRGEGREREAEPPPAGPVEPARNAPCPCGSGRKYKRCHGA